MVAYVYGWVGLCKGCGKEMISACWGRFIEQAQI